MEQIPDVLQGSAGGQVGSRILTVVVKTLLPSDVAEVKKDAKLRVVTSPALGYNSIIFNVANGDRSKAPIGQSALLRQAFELAIDRQALVDVVYSSM